MLRKRFMAVFIALSLSVLFVFPVFASVITSSDAVPSPVSSGDNTDVVNTVDYTGAKVEFAYYNSDSIPKRIFVDIGSDGYFSVPQIIDYVSLSYFEIRIPNSGLDTAGPNTLSFHFGSNTGGINYKDITVNNQSVSFTQSSGDIFFTTPINKPASNFLLIKLFFTDFDLPYGGYLKINVIGSGTDPVPPDIGGDTGGDTSGDKIAANTSQQVEQNKTIIGLIKDTISSVSNQFSAFWNQLAGEFTNLYNKMTAQHSEQLDADRQNTDDMIAAEESNTTNIINNNNANTDKVTGGYDNSGMLSENDRLNTSIDEYQKKEDEVINQAKDKVDTFEYGNHFEKFTAPLADISFFLTGIYQGLGSLNVPIAFSLTLSVSLLAVGYYRFKSGS